MLLYHGSNTPIESIDFSRCRPYKDFGKGFYLTDIAAQAERMAARVARIYGGTPYVTVFDFDFQGALASQDLKVKIFTDTNEEWARFVMANRDINTSQPFHDFDLVIGPVADDTISRLLRQFTENYINEGQLIDELKFAQPTSQFFFHTERALKFLNRHE